MYQTPKKSKSTVTSDDSELDVTPTNRPLKAKSLNLPENRTSNGSPSLHEKSVLSPSETRRGRPRADLLNTLILEGSTSPSSIKCKYCGRVFPREKSLQAHLRTHTGEKPYVCDYPRCPRRFAQSGQLKTHQRLHTGEKPFICAAPNCSRRFTHANRHCPDHPDYTLKRFSTKPDSNVNKRYDEAHNAEVREWLQNWDRRKKSSVCSNENVDTTPKKSIFKREESVFSSGSSAYFSGCSQNSSLTDDVENSPKSDLEDLDSSTYSSIESPEFDMQSKPSELPKKRWLREAVQDPSLWESTNDLACPINWGEEACIDADQRNTLVPNIMNENLKRPSVLVCVQGGKSKEISSDEIQGAMALVELKNGTTCNFNYRI